LARWNDDEYTRSVMELGVEFKFRSRNPAWGSKN